MAIGEQNKIKQIRPLGDRAMRFLLGLAHLVPRRLGYGLAWWGGRLFGRLAPRARAILESNLVPVLKTTDPRRLRRTAIEIFGHAARAYYELFYLPSVSPQKIIDLIAYDEPGWAQLQEIYGQGKGVMMVAPHMSSFDVAGQSLAAHGFNMLVLALPDREEGFDFINRLRTFQGVRVLPGGSTAVREAMRTLRAGGCVVTGADRPVKGQGTVVELFGRPTLLPDGAVRLALHTGAALVCTFCRREKNEYRLRFQPLDLIRGGEEEAAVRENVQQIARAMEPVIRAHPEQWHLFLRLWD